MQNHTSVPIPKFAHPRGPLRCELRNQRDTSNFMIVVRHLDLKFLNELAAIMIGNFKSAALGRVLIKRAGNVGFRGNSGRGLGIAECPLMTEVV